MLLQLAHDAQDCINVRLGELVRDLSVGEEYDAVRVGGGLRIVSDDDDCLAVLVDSVAQNAEDFGGAIGIQVAGGFVAKDDVRLGYQCASAGDALLLTAGELRGTVVQAFL